MKIAFGYMMGSGKDTAVNYMIRQFGGTRISFAEPMYEIMGHAQRICGFEREKDRKFLQWIGTEWAREKSPSVWVDVAIGKSRACNGNTFISDLRFRNEFDALKDDGWTCVKLTRPRPEAREGSGTVAHSSETTLNSIPDEFWDHVIDNSGDLDDLYRRLTLLAQDQDQDQNRNI
jgi:hypothetical protein